MRRARDDASEPPFSGTQQLIEELRPLSVAIAYRMLGTVSEAEDIVQEACSGSTARLRPVNRSSRRGRPWPL